MPTKQTLEDDLEELGEDTLSALPPGSRLKLMIRAQAEGDGDVVDRLREAVPERDYRGKDYEFRQQAMLSVAFTRQAVYTLHLSYMEYLLAHAQYKTTLLDTIARPETVKEEMLGKDTVSDVAEQENLDLSEDATEEFAEQNVHELAMQRSRQHYRQAATRLYVDYHTYKRFAEEEFDTTLSKFLKSGAPRPVPPWAFSIDVDVPEVLTDPRPIDFDDLDLEAVVTKAEEQGLLNDSVVAEDEDGSAARMELEAAIEAEYQGLVTIWRTGGEEDGDL